MKTEQELLYDANNAFYIWETKHYGDNSPLSDNDRLLWTEGFIAGAKNEGITK